MQSALTHTGSSKAITDRSVRIFTVAAAAFVLVSAALASLAPIAISVATVFLFAGPHNWVELRYFLSRLPSRFGPLKAFFISSFTGVLTLGISYASLVWLMHQNCLSYDFAIFSFRIWISGLFVWISALVICRKAFAFASNFQGYQSRTTLAALTVLAVFLGASLWQPLWFGLFLVYLHPIVGLCILDRELKRSKPHWLTAYRTVFAAIPVVTCLMITQLSVTPSLATSNLLNQQISRHAGSFLLPNLSSHMLVSIHTFLEMLHYGVWLLAIPLATAAVSRRKWVPANMPVAQNSKRLQMGIASAFVLSNILLISLWGSFIADYSATRDFYFTVAVFHILAELPFLLWLL